MSQDSGWSQGSVVTINIESLSNRGDGMGRWGDRVVFVPDAVPGDRLRVRLVRVKPSFGHGKSLEILEPSSYRVQPSCIVADKCGGCQWQTVAYEQQLQAKYKEVYQALERIGGMVAPTVNPVIASTPFHYRNKATYPLRRSPTTQTIQAGYYQKGSHKLINLNQCPVQDASLDPLLAEIKRDIQARGWSIYHEQTHAHSLRHLSLRVGRRTGEQLVTLVSCDRHLPGLDEQAQIWLERYPNLVGVCLNLNPQRTNAIFGSETVLIAGRDYLVEHFAGVTLRIKATTFFQINTEQAEQLLNSVKDALALTGSETVIDAYCGIGTLSLPLAQHVKRVVGIESHKPSVQQAQDNATANAIDNATFHHGDVETLLPQLSSMVPDIDTPDVVVLDPPRKGCDTSVLHALRSLGTDRIVYVSCNPATLARDLKHLCSPSTSHQSSYHLEHVQPFDFFPQTPHVESVAFLTRIQHA